MKDIQILKIENGWIILDGSLGFNHYNKKMWSALTVEDLSELVKKLVQLGEVK